MVNSTPFNSSPLLPSPESFHASPENASNACVSASARLKLESDIAKSLSRLSPPSSTTVVVLVPEADFVHQVAVDLLALGWLVSWAVTPDGPGMLIGLPPRGEVERHVCTTEPGRAAGFSVGGMSSGELRLDLDVDGERGSVYLSEQMWMAIGAEAGWVTKQAALDCWLKANPQPEDETP